jgi:DNA-binding phage protein
MDLIHNTVFRILDGQDAGIYRVILDEIQIGKTAVVRLDPPEASRPAKGGRKRLMQTKSPRKKPPPPMLGEILWMDRNELHGLKEGEDITAIEIEPDNYTLSDTDNEVYAYRKSAMAPFLDFDHFREMVLIHRGIGGLVNAVVSTGCSEAFVRKNFSLLCRYGFAESSLRPTRSLRCGAPGVPRPCDPGGRKKAGAKSIKEKVARASGITIAPEQPGISSDWTIAIMAADKRIPSPKPPMPERCKQIIESAFIKRYRQVDGKLVLIEPKLGDYPNSRQIRRVIAREIPRLQRLLEKTTKGHFTRSLRGLIGRNWKGVVGPGHTWAIDSSIGDIYLRSSVNRAWIIGRPIVYIIVDIWSTAIVGFYVCLDGPSWAMAKVALFCAAAAHELIGELWGYEAMPSLYPAPTMCAALLCDRGEYLSKGAKITGAKLIPCLSYAPPYRPDLKGLVEVIHRIEKDQQYYFVPGAIDQRRAEFELRRYDPSKAVLTIPEYVAYLYQIFTTYNLTAPREGRLDAHMHAAGVFPSPAGLWRYGHEVGIGVRRNLSLSELVTNLLPTESAHVNRHGVMLLGMQYESSTVDEQQWTALARNFGAWDIEANYFPGSVSRIWTPAPASTGLLDLRLSDNSTASRELTFDEAIDAFTVGKLGNAQNEHLRLMTAMAARQKAMDIIARAKELTTEALQKHSGTMPSITEARSLESVTVLTTPDATPSPDQTDDPARAAHQKMISALFAAANAEGVSHE